MRPADTYRAALLIQTAVRLLTFARTNKECWDCHLTPNFKGYCNVSIGGRNGERLRVHRLIYAVFVGPVAKDVFVCHSCDNRRCINPAHLFLGTAADNTADMMAKGRWNTDPEASTRRKAFTRSQILPLVAQGMSNGAIAAKLGLSYSGVWNHTREIRGNAKSVP